MVSAGQKSSPLTKHCSTNTRAYAGVQRRTFSLSDSRTSVPYNDHKGRHPAALMYFGDTDHRRENHACTFGRVYPVYPCLECLSANQRSTIKCFFRRNALKSKMNPLFLIVFCESKVVKSMIRTPIYGRPTRAPRPNVHIWPPLNLQKASKSAFFNGEVERREMPLLRRSQLTLI